MMAPKEANSSQHLNPTTLSYHHTHPFDLTLKNYQQHHLTSKF